MWRGGSCAAWCRPSLRWRQRFKWGWCEWEQNSLNWDRNAIRRGKIGAGGQRVTFTQYWFCSLSLKVQELVTEANEWRLFVSWYGCLFLQWRRHKVLFFFVFNLLPFVRGASAHQSRQKRLRRDYVEGAWRDLDRTARAIIQRRSISTHFLKPNHRKGGLNKPNMFHIRDAPEVIKLEYWPPKADKAGPGRHDHGGPTSHSGLGYTQSSVVSTAGKCLAAQPPPDDHFWLTDEGASNPRLEGERADVGILIESRCGGEKTHTHTHTEYTMDWCIPSFW